MATISRNRRGTLFVCLVLAALAFTACEGPQPRKSDAELGLNPQQARGRRIYDQYCDRCHEPYRDKGKGGPTMQGVFRKPFLASGMKASDERVGDVIMMGKSKMPAYRQVLNEQQLQDLLAYMHTL